MTDLRIILASGSPRRAEILRNIGVNFEICPTDTDETVEPGIPPSQLVCELAFRKANAVAAQLPENDPDTFIIAADTIVVRNGKVLGKPKDEDDAYRMLKTLSGSVHSVYTGFSLSQKDFYFTDHAVTDVEFMQLSDDLIYRYIKTGEPMDKAGAYGIQGKGSAFIRSIRGDYFNVNIGSCLDGTDAV